MTHSSEGSQSPRAPRGAWLSVACAATGTAARTGGRGGREAGGAVHGLMVGALGRSHRTPQVAICATLAPGASARQGVDPRRRRADRRRDTLPARAARSTCGTRARSSLVDVEEDVDARPARPHRGGGRRDARARQRVGDRHAAEAELARAAGRSRRAAENSAGGRGRTRGRSRSRASRAAPAARSARYGSRSARSAAAEAPTSPRPRSVFERVAAEAGEVLERRVDARRTAARPRTRTPPARPRPGRGRTSGCRGSCRGSRRRPARGRC